MPYKCVHCSMLYGDGVQELLTGCSRCGRKFFFYIKQEKLKEVEEKKELEIELNKLEKDKIEKDVRDITGLDDEESPVFLDFESVRIMREGKYLLDVSKLFSKEPRIYQLEDGKYIVDLSPVVRLEERKD